MLSLVLRRPRAATLALAAVLTGALPGVAGAQSSFTSLTVFGDSFSDSGNLFQAIGQPASPPYYMGRASNGPVWVEYFADLLGRPTDAAPAFALRRPSGNYAVAAARTATIPGGAPSTAEQIRQYLGPVGSPRTLDPTGLYVLFGGGNDLRDIGGLADASLRRAAAAATALRLGAQADTLARSGARNVLLPFLPMLGFTPEALATPGRSAVMNELTTIFNTTLAGQIATLRGAYVGTTFFDLRLDALFTNILADVRGGGSRYGFTNATLPCLPGIAPAGAPSCDVSVFADTFHPTTKAHQIIADAAYNRVVNGIDVAVVPEPATMVLFGSGLVLLAAGGTLRRRRAAARDAA